MEIENSNLADTRILLVVHKTFRGLTTKMIDATARLEPKDLRSAIGPYWRFFHAILEYHHHNEDHHEFPALIERYPAAAALIAELGHDHLRMVAVMEEIESAVRAFEQNADAARRDRINAEAVALRELFFPHLDREDAEVVPLYAKWIPPKVWTKMNNEALKGIPKPQLPFAVGALDETIRSLPAAEQPPGPPPPVRMMLTLSWRKKWSSLVQPLVA